MPEIPNLLAFVAASFILLIVPGPTVLFVISKSIDQGKVAAIVSVFGIALGSAVHVIGAALGISAILSASELAFNILKFTGAGYLIYLGLTNLFAKQKVSEVKENKRNQKLTTVFFQGTIVNVLNPKTALFIFSFIPQFVTVGPYPVEAQILTLGLCLILMGIFSDIIYVIIANYIGKLLRTNSEFLRIQKRISGSIYLILGLMTLAFQPIRIK